MSLYLEYELKWFIAWSRYITFGWYSICRYILHTWSIWVRMFFFLTPDFDGIWSNLFSLLTRQTLDWWYSWDIINLYIVSQLEFNISLINFFIDDFNLSTFFHQSDHSWFNVFILILSSSTFEYLLYFVWFHSFFPSSSYINRNIWYCIPSSSPTNHWC